MPEGNPKIYYKYKSHFDFAAWFWTIISFYLVLHFGGVFNIEHRNLWMVASVFLFSWEYIGRIAWGKLFSIIYYDTIVHTIYELFVEDSEQKTYFVAAQNRDELDLYMEMHYPGLEYNVVNSFDVESFIKTDQRV
jgi:hypothetical protein